MNIKEISERQPAGARAEVAGAGGWVPRLRVQAGQGLREGAWCGRTVRPVPREKDSVHPRRNLGKCGLSLSISARVDASAGALLPSSKGP